MLNIIYSLVSSAYIELAHVLKVLVEGLDQIVDEFQKRKFILKFSKPHLQHPRCCLSQ